MMRQIKIFFYFLLAVCAIVLICSSGVLGIVSIYKVIEYLVAHCPDLLAYGVISVFGIVGVIAGWFMFTDSLNNLSKS